MEKTLIIFKPCALQRRLVGELINRLEKKGLLLIGMKMIKLTDKILDEHYSHLIDKPYFQQIKDSMMKSPVIVSCWKGVNAIAVVRSLVGSTNGREASPGTIRGDYCMSVQENIIHASDSVETAKSEIERFFHPNELFSYNDLLLSNLYADNEI